MPQAELRARLTLNKSLFDRGIASAMSGAQRLGSGLMTAGRIGARAFTLGAAAVAGLSTTIAIGTKRAFDLGGRMVDIRNLTGKSAKQIMVMRRALEDAGVSMEKIDTYMVTGRDRGNVIARTLANLTKEDWASAAASVGTQADILNRSADKFDKISDILGHSGEKFQGFFVGVADRVADTLLPILEKLDKTDMAGFGQKFGDGLVQGARIVVGFFKDPSLLFGAAVNYLKAGVLGIGNILIAVGQRSFNMWGAFLGTMFEGVGPILQNVFTGAGLLLKSGMLAAVAGMFNGLVNANAMFVALMQSGVQRIINFFSGNWQQALISGISAAAQKLFNIVSPFAAAMAAALAGNIPKAIGAASDLLKGVHMPSMPAFQVGGETDIGKLYKAQQDRIRDSLGGITDAVDEIGKQAEQDFRAASGHFSQAGQAAMALPGKAEAAMRRAGSAPFSVPDVLGAGAALAAGNANVSAAASAGGGGLAAAIGAKKTGFERFTGFTTASSGGLLDKGRPQGLTSSGLTTHSGMSAAYNQSAVAKSAEDRVSAKRGGRKEPASAEDLDRVMAKYW